LGPLALDCSECVHANKKGRNKGPKKKNKGDRSDVWICLACGHTGCGREKAGHALLHAQKNSHAMAVHFGDWRGWCYPCDSELEHRAPHIEKAISILGKAEMPPTNTDPSTVYQSQNNTGGNKKKKNKIKAELDLKVAVDLVTNQKRKNGVKGLVNIGNTCFFNSIMQVLTHISLLRTWLLENIGNIPAEEGRLTSALRYFFAHMWHSEESPFTPRVLFNVVCEKCTI